MKGELVTGGCIQVSGLSMSFRGRSVLADVDLEVPTGSVAVVEGDNGSGKTTLVGSRTWWLHRTPDQLR